MRLQAALSELQYGEPAYLYSVDGTHLLTAETPYAVIIVDHSLAPYNGNGFRGTALRASPAAYTLALSYLGAGGEQFFLDALRWLGKEMRDIVKKIRIG